MGRGDDWPRHEPLMPGELQHDPRQENPPLSWMWLDAQQKPSLLLPSSIGKDLQSTCWVPGTGLRLDTGNLDTAESLKCFPRTGRTHQRERGGEGTFVERWDLTAQMKWSETSLLLPRMESV